jgi:hypothetical protein
MGLVGLGGGWPVHTSELEAVCIMLSVIVIARVDGSSRLAWLLVALVCFGVARASASSSSPLYCFASAAFAYCATKNSPFSSGVGLIAA